MAVPTTFNVDGLIVLQDALETLLEGISDQIHYHLLLIVEDKTALDTDTDTALITYMEGLDWEVDVADESDVASTLELDAYDCVIVSGSVTTTANLVLLRFAVAPVVTLSPNVAVTNLFIGTVAGTELTETQIEIVENSHNALLNLSLGDLAVTASTTLKTLGVKSANAVTLAEEATGTGNDITMLVLLQGSDDGGAPSYTPLFDRYFFGVCDFTLINGAGKAIFKALIDHAVNEKRLSEETVVRAKKLIEWETEEYTDAATVAGAEIPIYGKSALTKRLWVISNGILKCGIVGPDTVTVRLKVLYGGALTTIKSFAITVANFATYHMFIDMFGIDLIMAEEMQISLQSSGVIAIDFEFTCIEGSVRK